MANYLVLRLVPKEPVGAVDFTPYLQNLSFDVLDVSFASAPGGTSILTSGGFAETVQHQRDTAVFPPPPVWTSQSVATAVLEIDLPSPEYREPDVVLVISRSSVEIARLSLGYNVAFLIQASPPDTDPLTEAFRNIPAENVAAYVPLQDPALGGLGFELPDDGSPPKFGPLRLAVEEVLNDDPGTLGDIASLTPATARHVAREIIWNRSIAPLPAPTSMDVLEDMYTDDGTDARSLFEAELLRFRVEHESRSEALAQYVFALSAAIFAEDESAQAERAGLAVPARPGAEPLPGKRRDVEVILVESP